MNIEILESLFEKKFDKAVLNVKALPLSGSARRYYRLSNAEFSVIGTFNPDVRENHAFTEFSRHFLDKGLTVPEIFAVSDDKLYYMEEDLGDMTLFDFANETRKDNSIPPLLHEMYRKALKELVNFQVYGHNGLDYSLCTPRNIFDKQSMLWDLNYFKSFFLKLSGVPFDEQQLETDFLNFTSYLDTVDKNNFLYRDFQSRNIMLHKNNLYFIDYQGGRRGALQYDVASFLFEAKTDLPEEFREDLLGYYLDVLTSIKKVDKSEFRQFFYPFALIRTFQALGAYGFRGLVEKKAVFLQSIPHALKNLKWLIEHSEISGKLPELSRVSIEIANTKRFDYHFPINTDILTIRIFSFSYMKNIPDDLTGHGGGFVFDCRGIHNPGKYLEFKNFTGKDEPVKEFLKNNSEMKGFLDDVYSLINRHIEFYKLNNYKNMQVCFGCTGGRHRSVYAAEQIYEKLTGRNDVEVILKHMEC